eukprot:4263063-Prymnesium_polylepis.1
MSGSLQSGSLINAGRVAPVLVRIQRARALQPLLHHIEALVPGELQLRLLLPKPVAKVSIRCLRHELLAIHVLHGFVVRATGERPSPLAVFVRVAARARGCSFLG